MVALAAWIVGHFHYRVILDSLTMSGEESSEDDRYVDVICYDRAEVTGELSKINLGSVQKGKSSAQDHVWLASRLASLSGKARINILPSFRTAAAPLRQFSRPTVVYCSRSRPSTFEPSPTQPDLLHL